MDNQHEMEMQECIELVGNNSMGPFNAVKMNTENYFKFLNNTILSSTSHRDMNEISF